MCVHTTDPLPVNEICSHDPYKWVWPTTFSEVTLGILDYDIIMKN